MGWWKVQGTEDLVGDEVFSLLRRAAISVAVEYQEAVGRVPTTQEWQHLILLALHPVENDDYTVKSYLIEEGRPTEIEIRVAGGKP